MITYDFSNQIFMLKGAKSIIDNLKINDNVALGGGTLLAFYWNHRFSTDIDIFMYGKESYKYLDLVKPKYWTDDIKEQFIKLNFKDKCKYNPIYTELTISKEEKIQFLSAKGITKDKPFSNQNIWEIDFNLETVEEIIAKKIYYRCEKNYARDIFDIAIAIHKNPLLPKILYDLRENFQKKFNLLYCSLEHLINSNELYELYKKEIYCKINSLFSKSGHKPTSTYFSN